METQSLLMILKDSLVIIVGAITRIEWFGALNVIEEDIVRTAFRHGVIKYHLKYSFFFLIFELDLR